MNLRTRCESMTENFSRIFPGTPTLFRAPARVNIIGEHTDYNDGWVLPTTTALYTWMAAAARDDRRIRVFSKGFPGLQTFDLDDVQRSEVTDWIDYLKGVARMLEDDGGELTGADIYIEGEIPVGGGLSSSASLELVTAIALLHFAGRNLPREEIARLCQKAEVEFVGLNCGIMDQLAIACCGTNSAMLLDCRSLAWESLAMPDDLRFLLVDCGVKHQLPLGEYNDRAMECGLAIEKLQNVLPGLGSLRDLRLDDLQSNRDCLTDTLYRRCRHVVTENQRTNGAFDALKACDISSLGQLINDSHVSLRDDYEVSCRQMDTLVDIATGCRGVSGARMVGAGFGGCALILTSADLVGQARDDIVTTYARESGKAPWSHIVKPAVPAQSVVMQGEL